MQLEHILQAHGLIGRGSGKSTPLPELINFTAVSKNDGSGIDLSWQNSDVIEYIRTEIYASTENIQNADYEYCVANASIVINSNTTINETITSYSVGTTVYFKGFMVFNILGEIKVNNGVGLSCTVIDIVPPSTITSFTAKVGDKQVELSWINPTDSDFSKVKILYKQGSYPVSFVDGLVAYEGSGTTIVVTGLTNDIEYYFRAFTYDTNGNINNNIENQQIIVIPQAYKIYGVKIDETNSNPETSVTYIDDAVGFTPMRGNNGSFQVGSWDNTYPLNEIKPCLLKNGIVNYYLNPNDYTKKIDGSLADITSGNDGDVMIEFPKLWWKMEKVGTDQYVRFATAPVDGFKCLAHTIDTIEKDKIYLPAYMGYTLSGKLRSLSSKTPTVSQTIGTFRTQAQANGTGYQQMTYYSLLMLQVLYVVWFKSLDSQTALGRGYVDGNSSSIVTGGTNTKGLFYGETSGKQQNKFAGIEDFWGNTFYWIDGFYSDNNRNILISNQDVFNDTGSGYVNYGQGATADITGYIDIVQGSTETGFVIKTKNGSATTYYCDYGALYAGRMPRFGGSWADASNAGAFQLNVNRSAANSNSNLAARLCFIGG